MLRQWKRPHPTSQRRDAVAAPETGRGLAARWAVGRAPAASRSQPLIAIRTAPRKARSLSRPRRGRRGRQRRAAPARAARAPQRFRKPRPDAPAEAARRRPPMARRFANRARNGPSAARALRTARAGITTRAGTRANSAAGATKGGRDKGGRDRDKAGRESGPSHRQYATSAARASATARSTPIRRSPSWRR